MAMTQQQAKEAARASYPANAKAVQDLLFAIANGDFTLVAAGVTVTAAQLNAAAGGALGAVVIADATPYTVLAANSGKPHLIVDQTANITINLPAVASGLVYTFRGKASAAEAQNWIFVAPAGAFVDGGLSFADNDAGAGADEIHAGIYGNGSSHLTTTIVTPCAGTYVTFISDGTKWTVGGWINSPTVPTIA